MAGLAIGALVGVVTYAATSAWPPAVLAFVLAAHLVGYRSRVIFRGRRRLRLALFVLVRPATMMGVALLAHRWWGNWLLAVAVGLVGGWLLGFVISFLLFPRTFREVFVESRKAE
jgi:hypothetical protein